MTAMLSMIGGGLLGSLAGLVWEVTDPGSRTGVVLSIAGGLSAVAGLALLLVTNPV